MIFCILNSVRYPVPRTHRLHVQKLAAGFIQLGYHFKELQSEDALKYLGAQDIVYISNHFSTELTHRLFSTRLSQQLARLLEQSRCRLLLWNFHTAPGWQETTALSERVVHLGECMLESAVRMEGELHTFRVRNNVFELRYSSPTLPSRTFAARPNVLYDCNFIGAGYQQSWTRHCANRYCALIRNTPPLVPESLRWNGFRESLVNLVFHSPANIRKGIVVERFAEAISLGGLIAHDHPRIREQYGDRAGFRYIDSIKNLDLAIEECRQMSHHEQQSARQLNYELWVHERLSYRDQAAQIRCRFKGEVA